MKLQIYECFMLELNLCYTLTLKNDDLPTL